MKAQGLLDTSPMERVTKPHARDKERFHVFTPDEVRRITAATKRTPAPERDLAIVHFLLSTGVRASEMCALTFGDVDFAERKALIRSGKGDKSRWVHWGPTTGRALWRYVQVAGIPEGEDPATVCLFRSVGGNTRGAGLTRHGLRQVLETVGQIAGVAHCHPHTFRHTMATLSLLAGMPQMTLQRLLGHATLHMTERYVRLTGADLAGAARQFDPVEFIQKRK
jgi:integrase